DGKYTRVETIVWHQALADRDDPIAGGPHARDIFEVDRIIVDAPVDTEPRAAGCACLRNQPVEGRLHKMVAHREQGFVAPDQRLRCKHRSSVGKAIIARAYRLHGDGPAMVRDV